MDFVIEWRDTLYVNGLGDWGGVWCVVVVVGVVVVSVSLERISVVTTEIRYK